MTDTSACLHYDTELIGAFCHACGQRATVAYFGFYAAVVVLGGLVGQVHMIVAYYAQ